MMRIEILDYEDLKNRDQYEKWREKIGVTSVEVPRDMSLDCIKAVGDALALHGYVISKHQGAVAVKRVQMLRSQAG